MQENILPPPGRVKSDQESEKNDLPPDLFRQAILEHALCLGMDPYGNEVDSSLLWIAERSLLAPLPAGWSQMTTKDTGHIYYYNSKTGESNWSHPCDESYRNLFLQEKQALCFSQNVKPSFPYLGTNDHSPDYKMHHSRRFDLSRDDDVRYKDTEIIELAKNNRDFERRLQELEIGNTHNSNRNACISTVAVGVSTDDDQTLNSETKHLLEKIEDLERDISERKNENKSLKTKIDIKCAELLSFQQQLLSNKTKEADLCKTIESLKFQLMQSEDRQRNTIEEAEKLQLSSSFESQKRALDFKTKIEKMEETLIERNKELILLQTQLESERKIVMEQKECLREVQEVKNRLDVVKTSNADLERKNEKIGVELGRKKEALLETMMQIEKLKQELDEACSKVSNEAMKRQMLEQDLIDYETKNKQFFDEMSKLKEARKVLTKKLADSQGSIRVLCRIRPNNDLEKIVRTTVYGNDKLIFDEHEFEFDHIFPQNCSQEEVFEEIHPAIETAMKACNVSLFAYGQTGSGKTYTMEGPENNRGVNLRALRSLFDLADEAEGMKYSYQLTILEVYNETIHDLLADSKRNFDKHDIRTDQVGQVYVEGIKYCEVCCTNDVEKLLEKAAVKRTTANNNINERSSRSHLVVTCYITGMDTTLGTELNGKLNLIDLAGSERLKSTEVEGVRLKEAMNINKSLSSLGDVISALGNKSKHIPYRNSKLTHLLKVRM